VGGGLGGEVPQRSSLYHTDCLCPWRDRLLSPLFPGRYAFWSRASGTLDGIPFRGGGRPCRCRTRHAFALGWHEALLQGAACHQRAGRGLLPGIVDDLGGGGPLRLRGGHTRPRVPFAALRACKERRLSRRSLRLAAWTLAALWRGHGIHG